MAENRTSVSEGLNIFGTETSLARQRRGGLDIEGCSVVFTDFRDY